jgi:5-methylthioadenosine/S-adenosylhomocysteine deaminase
MDGSSRVLHDAAVAVANGTIRWVGTSKEARQRFAAARTIDAAGSYLVPGLVDTHFHTCQQLLRGKLVQLARRKRLKVPIWRNYLIPFEQALSEEDVHLSGLVAYANSLHVGTTCFAEAGGPHPDHMARAAVDVGIRGIVALSTMDTGEGLPAGARLTTKRALEENLRLVKAWGAPAAGNRVGAWLALRQLMVCSPGLWEDAGRLAEEAGTRIHVHLAEGTYEVEYAAQEWGKRPAEHLHETGFLSPRVHAAHSILLSDEEVAMYAADGVSVAHCPMGNFLIGAPKVPQMLSRGIPLGLGTDGGSTGSLDLFQAMRVSWVALQSRFGTPWHTRDVVSLDALFEMATIGGARALGLETAIGSLERGKRADLVLLSSGTWDQEPATDVPFAVARSATGRDVHTVVIDGAVVLEGGRLLTVDEEALRARLAERLPAIMNRFESLIGGG